MMKKRKKIILLLMVSILFAVAGLVKIFLDKMNCSVVESGKANVEVVVEQIQQTYELQIESFYSRMRVIDAYVAQGNTEILEITNAMNLFESWQKETGAQIFFIKENGSATTIDKKDLRLEISSTLLMDLRAGRNIAKLISYNDDAKTETGFLMAIPCSEYYIDGEAYTAIGALVDRSDIDSVLKLYAYGGEAFLYMLDASGDVIYTNRQDEKLFQNYSLLKHLKKENVLTDEQAAFLEKEFEEQHHGTELFGEDKAYYLGYCPGDNNNSTLVCIVPRATVDNALMSYQKTFFYTTLFTAMFVFLLLAGLCCSLARIHMAKQRIIYEKKTRKQQQQNLKELESLNEELKEAQTAATEALRSAEIANKAKSDFLSNISHDIRTPMNAIIGITSLIKHDADNEAKVLEDIKKIEISSQNLLEIINDVLDMNKIESGKATLAYTDFSIYELIQEVNVLFRPQTNAKHQTFEIITENIRHEWLNGDKVRLMQIFSNLLSNAVKYTQKSGKIQFYIEEYSTGSSAYAKYRFLVKDNGMGMDAAFQDKIFDAFTREERSLTNKI